MLKKILLDKEIILFQENIYHLVGVVSQETTIVVTNHQILLLPAKGWFNNFGQAKKQLIWDDIIDMKMSWRLTLVTAQGEVHLSGPTIIHVYQTLMFFAEKKVTLDTPKEKLDALQIFFSGAIQIYLGVGISRNGHLQILRDGIRVESTSNLLKQSYHIAWEQLTNITFASLNQVLTLTTAEQEFSIIGPQAQLLDYVLNMISQGEMLYDSITEITLRKGQLHTSGYIFLGVKHMHLVPCGIFGTTLGFEPKKEKLKNLESYRCDESNITVSFSNVDNWVFDVYSPYLWMTYTQQSVLHMYKRRYTISNPFCYFIDSANHQICFGFLYVHDHILRFVNIAKEDYLSIPVTEILSVQQKSTRLTIQQNLTPHTFEFSSTEITQALYKRISPLLPITNASFSRNSNDISDIFGEAKNVSLYVDGVLVAHISRPEIRQRNNTLQIKANKQDASVNIPKKASMEIDVTREKGHYTCSAVLLENYLQKSDVAGQYYITTTVPNHIQLLNQRSAFRVPTKEPVDVEVYTENFRKCLGQKNGVIIDISATGCKIEFKGELESELNSHVIIGKYLAKFSLCSTYDPENILLERDLPVSGTILRCFYDEDADITLMGVQFTDIPSVTENALLRKVLLIEREYIRKQRELKEIMEEK